jgi:hypothetical protein
MKGLSDLIQGPEQAQAVAHKNASGRPVRLAVVVVVAVVSIAIAIAGVVQHARGLWAAWRGPAWVMGVAAAICVVILMSYSLPKRLAALPMIQGWWARWLARFTMRQHLGVHSVVGMLALALMFAHGGGRVTASTGGALQLSILLSAAVGGLTAFIYAVVPAWLTRIERQALLPEDRQAACQDKYDRLYAAMSGRDPLVKRLFERVLLSYLNTPWGPLELILSGRGLGEEEQRLRHRVDRMLQGRGAERLQGLEAIICLLVEIRALRAQGLLSGVLRCGLPIHIVTASVSAVLLILHVAESLN